MLLKKNIENIFNKNFYKLAKIFKKYGYLQTLGSYNKDVIKYVTDIDIQFIINNKGKKTFEDYYDCLVYLLSNCEILFNLKDNNLIFEAVKTIQETKYNIMDNVSDDDLDFNRKSYSIKEILDDKDILKKVYDNFGIVKINMFLNYNNGDFFVPIDLIIIKQFTLSEDKNNVKTCVLSKDSIKNKKYLKCLKQIRTCMLILTRFGYINLPSHLFDDGNDDDNKDNLKLTKKKTNSTILSQQPEKKVKTKKINKKMIKLINTGEVKEISSTLRVKIVKMYKDINKTILDNYYVYSIFSYIGNIKKIITLPVEIFNKLYNFKNIYKLQNILKKIISILLKKRKLLTIKNNDKIILETIYNIKIDNNNYIHELEPIINILEKIEYNFEKLFKEKAITYYKMYLKLSNYFMENDKQTKPINTTSTTTTTNNPKIKKNINKQKKTKKNTK
jgi:hypothetical protein